MSNTSGGNSAHTARSTIFATRITGSGANTALSYVGSYTGLRADLISWDQSNGNALGLAASGAAGLGGHDATALNMEGMEFVGNSTSTVYLSFRAPLEPTSNRHLALLVPLTTRRCDHVRRQPRHRARHLRHPRSSSTSAASACATSRRTPTAST